MTAPRASTPPAALTFDELVAGTDVSRRTLRHWTGEKLLPAPERRGPATRYTDAQRARLLAIVALRGQGVGIPEIRQRFAQMSAREIAAMGAGPSAAMSVPSPPTAPTYAAEPWERVVLLPGLELHVNTAGGPLLRRIAQEIVTHYSAGARGA